MQKSIYIFIAAGVVLALLGTWWLKPVGQVTNYPASGTDIIAFGDSLVAGTGASPGKDFVSLLSQKIGEPIINLGMPGDTTATGLARIHELAQYDPKVVLLLLGGNDYLRRTPPEEAFANLSQIIEYIHSTGAIVILLGVRGGLLRDNFDSEFEALERQHNTAYVSDVLDGLLGSGEYMADQIHPNDAGHAIIADRIYPVLTKLLE